VTPILDDAHSRWQQTGRRPEAWSTALRNRTAVLMSLTVAALLSGASGIAVLIVASVRW
jgi:hypothetical protein